MVQSVLERQNEQLERHYRLRAHGYDFDSVVDRVAKLFGMRQEEILRPGKQPQRVRARGLVCYWSVRELGMNGTAVAKLLGITQSSVSRAVERFGSILTWHPTYSEIFVNGLRKAGLPD